MSEDEISAYEKLRQTQLDEMIRREWYWPAWWSIKRAASIGEGEAINAAADHWFWRPE